VTPAPAVSVCLSETLAQDRLGINHNHMKILSMLVGFVAAEAFLIYAIFIAHTLKPISFHLIEQSHSGVPGKYQELFHADGLLLTLVASLMVLAFVWLAARGTASTIAAKAA
jgi:hypothetical protein